MKPSLDVIELFKEVIRDYRWDINSDKDMLSMFASDRKDFRKVLSLYRKGEWEEAAEYAGHMDTAAREHIPQKIWDDIQSVR
jgi:hypothetical protein